MDITSGLKTDVFKTLITMVIPGAVGVAPYICVIVKAYPAIVTFADNHAALAGVVLFGLAMTVGIILHEAGARVELRLEKDYCHSSRSGDQSFEERKEQFYEEWYKYLRLALKVEPIGQHYIRDVLLRLKFELNFACALVLMMIGVAIISYQRGLPTSFPLIAFCCTGLLWWFLFSEARAGVALLAILRANLLDEITVIGADGKPTETTTTNSDTTDDDDDDDDDDENDDANAGVVPAQP